MRLDKIPFVVRGFVAFSIGGIAATLAEALMMRIAARGTNVGFVTSIVVMGLAGAGAGALLALGTDAVWRAAAGFGVGMGISWFLSVFVLMSIQGGGKPGYLWVAVGCGVAYGIAGAVGGATLGCRSAAVGALAFAIAGAVAGLQTAWLAVRGGPLLLIHSGTLVAYVIGGTLLGLGLDMEGGL